MVISPFGIARLTIHYTGPYRTPTKANLAI